MTEAKLPSHEHPHSQSQGTDFAALTMNPDATQKNTESSNLKRDYLESQTILLTRKLIAEGVDVTAALSKANRDGCLTTTNPLLWSLVNINFASGRGYSDNRAREVIPITVPATFSAQSVWNALAAKIGKDTNSREKALSYIRSYLEAATPASDLQRGTEVLHLALQFDLTNSLVSIGHSLPDTSKSDIANLWKPAYDAYTAFLKELNAVEQVLDELNEKYLITFSLCIPNASALISEKLSDTIW